MVGGRNQYQAQQETNDGNLRNVESGGEEITTIEELDGLVGGERMELREEHVLMLKKMKKKKKDKF